ncbi:type II toxin-antitoxin system VapC family toxin [Patescibacteria group bacterium]|nr:type II toxin-antitoxin system VapC family toxin [Patescibacteria group bacterium]MCG2701511.1 type II toxin-antitoxin system VapC family toxin [Candidatus Parcubacteria bacterium]MBU4209818.1 type II toxin-antitoxin system VapC family toxin [Patescibacteria group bacterium]MBU4265286.1 type II toxin-antitoxin system VapC family toxin [Patescibacteria group bacterium]MBU4389971.1 type II toxin-antitoxin system VapC family toxin [Patescibacteria group bacterium]
MEKIVIDTSVVVKWFVEEDDFLSARDLLDRYKKGKVAFVVPRILFLELINALFFGVGKYRRDELKAALLSFVALRCEIVDMDIDLFFVVSELMNKFEIAAYDALFIALAKRKNIYLISADKKHHKKEFYKKIKYLGE